MKEWQKVLKEKELFVKNMRIAYWEKFGSLPTVSELTQGSFLLQHTKQKGVNTL